MGFVLVFLWDTCTRIAKKTKKGIYDRVKKTDQIALPKG